MVDQVTPITSQQQPVVQGAGSWANYIGPGASNLTDPARVSALTSAGLGMMASFQNPAVYDAIQERQKYVESFTNPLITAGLSATNLANIPLADIASRYGPNVANATQSYFTANPTQKAMDIVNAYGVQSTNIIGSSGIQRYIGTTIDKGYAIYSEAGGVNPFRANVLTEYQQGAVGNIANDVISGKFAESGIQGLSNALVGIRGIESGAGLIVSDFTSRFATPTIQEPTPIAQPAQIAPQSQGNFITDFFGGFAKSGYAAGAGAIQPFAGSQQYMPIYESLMAKPTEERLTGSKVIAGLPTIQSTDYMVDSGAGVKAPFVSARYGASETPATPYTEQALSAASQRAGYTPIESLGDVRTEQFTKSYQAAYNASKLMGINIASPDLMTGRVLETQRQSAYATPTLADDRFFGGELQKWAENKVELASAYHDIGQVTGKPIAANPYEYTGDLAVEFLKGAPTRATERFSPVSGELAAIIPTGGLQGYAWESALAADRGTAQPAAVSFMPGVNYLGASEGLMGPYGALAGGTGAKYVTPIAAPESAGPGAYLTGEMRVLGNVSPMVKSQTQIGEPFYPTTVVKDPFAFGTSFGEIAAGATSLYGVGAGYVFSLLSRPKETTPSFNNQTSVKTMISGGNETITALGNWIDANKGNVNPYDANQVNAYNDAVDTYNKMSKQNPIITTTETTTTGYSVSKSSSNPEQGFLSGLYSTVGIPSFPQAEGLVSGVGGFATRLLGAAVNPKYEQVSPLGMVATGGESGFIERYGLPIAAGAVAALTLGGASRGEGISLPQLPQYDLSVPSKANSLDFTGLGFIASTKNAVGGGVTRLQEMWEGGGAPVQVPGAWNLPKITDVTESPVFKAPGEGYQQIVNLPGEGLQIIAGLPGAGRNLIAKTGEAISLPFSGGFGNVIQMPKPTITPEDIISPLYGFGGAASRATEQARAVVERPIFDLNVNSAAQNVFAAKEAVVSQFAPDYATKLAAAATGIGAAIATPYWWTKTSYASRAAEQNALSTPFSYVGTQAQSLKQSVASDMAIAMPNVLSYQYNVQQPVTTRIVNQYDTSMGSAGRASPKSDIKIEIPWLPSFPFGGGGDLGSTRKRKRYFKETFWMGLDVSGPVVPIPKEARVPKLKRSGIPGGKQKTRTPTRRKKR